MTPEERAALERSDLAEIREHVERVTAAILRSLASRVEDEQARVEPAGEAA